MMKNKMSKREKILKGLIKDILWMAIRYARKRKDGQVVLACIRELQRLYSNFKIHKDIIMERDEEHYLYTLFWDWENYELKIQQRVLSLREAISGLLPFAVRYANGRHTYAPSIIRDVVEQLVGLYPKFRLHPDITIKPPTKEELEMPAVFKSDYLYDLFEEE